MAKTREDAYELLCQHVQSPALQRHMLGVEACMRHYARRMDGDVEAWGIAGLLHDMDYEEFPSLEDHPYRGAEILRAEGYPEETITAILGHGNHTGVQRDTDMAKVLFAVDELSGFVTAVSLVRPGGLEGMDARSVQKKMKDKAFARGVNRDDIVEGAEGLGIPLDEHISEVITALREMEDA